MYIKKYLSEALPGGDMVCFTVVTRLLDGTFILVFASIGMIFIGTYVMRISEHALEDRTRRDGGINDEETEEEWGLGESCCADCTQVCTARVSVVFEILGADGSCFFPPCFYFTSLRWYC